MAFLRDSSLYCIPNATFSKEKREIIGSVCISTCTVGFIGAVFQIKSLWRYRYRQRRGPSADPRIILYLAFCDMMACLGIFILAILFIEFVPVTVGGQVQLRYDMTKYEYAVTALEIVTIFSFLASCIWTFLYALDMSIQIYGGHWPMISYHILAWMIPLTIVCVVEGTNFGIYPNTCERTPGQMSRLILSYFLVPLVIFGNSVLFALTYRKIKKLTRANAIFTDDDRVALRRFKRKFFFMVFAFAICWIPNIVSVCYDIKSMSSKLSSRCMFIRDRSNSLIPYFTIIEAAINPLQGLFNYIIYRKSFRVAATDATSIENSLPVASSAFSWAPSSNNAESLSTSRTYSNWWSSRNESSRLLGPGPSTNTYSYTTKLLGE